MNEYIYQWSYKLDSGEIYVVHSNDLEDFKQKRKEIMVYITSLELRKEIDSVPIEKELDSVDKPHGHDFEEEMEELAEESYCKLHKVTMKERMGKNGKFYSHAKGEYPDLDWCSGRGFKNE